MKGVLAYLAVAEGLPAHVHCQRGVPAATWWAAGALLAAGTPTEEGCAAASLAMFSARPHHWSPIGLCLTPALRQQHTSKRARKDSTAPGLTWHAREAQIVFSSSCTVYGNPTQVPIDEAHPLKALSPYGRSKLIIEDMFRDVAASPKESGWRIILLRYFNPVGAHPSGARPGRAGHSWPGPALIRV